MPSVFLSVFSRFDTATLASENRDRAINTAGVPFSFAEIALYDAMRSTLFLVVSIVGVCAQ